MSVWQPTNELRFVERREYNTFHLHDEYKIVRILQQKWELNDPKFAYQAEWRDVPVVEEE